MSENDSSVLSELRGLASTKVVIISQQFRFGKKQLAVLSSAEPCSSVQLITVRTLEAGVSVNQTGWRVICKKKNFARWPLYGPSHCKNSLTSCNAIIMTILENAQRHKQKPPKPTPFVCSKTYSSSDRETQDLGEVAFLNRPSVTNKIIEVTGKTD